MPNLILLLLLFFCASDAFCAGQTSANFLKIAVGAKNSAMGETGAAEPGIGAIYWNPAGLAAIGHTEVSFNHTAWFQGLNFESGSIAMRLGQSAIAVSFDSLTTPPMDRYDNTGGRQGSFMLADQAIKLTYAADVSATPENTYVGITFKDITSYIDSLSAHSLAVDAGVFFDTVFDNLRFGVVFQNMGNSLKFDRQSYSLPKNLKAGANYVINDALNISADINKSIDTDTILNTGGEYLYPVGEDTSIALRGGYKRIPRGLKATRGSL